MSRIKIILTAALVATATSASALPDAIYSAEAFGGTTAQFLSTVGTASSSGPGASGSATTSGYQRVSAAGSATPGPGNEGIFAASATYYFGVLGPAAVSVPLILRGTASLAAHGCNGNSGCSSVEVYEDYGRNGSTFSNFGPITCSEGAATCGDFSFTQSLSLTSSTSTTTGDTGFTHLSIYVLAYYGNAGGFIDPVITIDPSFADASQYQVVFSSGTGNPVAAVPEPSAWAMLLTGFAFAGGAVRRQRVARSTVSA